MREACHNAFDALEFMFFFREFDDVAALFLNEMDQCLRPADFLKFGPQQYAVFRFGQLVIMNAQACTRTK